VLRTILIEYEISRNLGVIIGDKLLWLTLRHLTKTMFSSSFQIHGPFPKGLTHVVFPNSTAPTTPIKQRSTVSLHRSQFMSPSKPVVDHPDTFPITPSQKTSLSIAALEPGASGQPLLLPADCCVDFLLEATSDSSVTPPGTPAIYLINASRVLLLTGIVVNNVDETITVIPSKPPGTSSTQASKELGLIPLRTL
jgi:hypothetical protein